MAEAADPVAALADIPTPPRSGDDWKAFVDTLGNLRYSEWPVDLERARLWYEPHLERIYEDAETRRADLIQLEQIASGYPSRERFHLLALQGTSGLRSGRRDPFAFNGEFFSHSIGNPVEIDGDMRVLQEGRNPAGIS